MESSSPTSGARLSVWVVFVPNLQLTAHSSRDSCCRYEQGREKVPSAMMSAILNQLMAHTGTKPLAWHRDEWLMDCMVAWASGSPRPVRGGQPSNFQTGFLMGSRVCVCVCLCAWVFVCVGKHRVSYHVSSIDLVPKATITSMLVLFRGRKRRLLRGTRQASR